MRIGLDIDGVIFNSENEIRVRSELYDLLEVKGDGVKYTEEFMTENRYNWTEEQKNTFRKGYLLEASKAAALMPGAKQVIELLQKEGHELVIITARGKNIKEMKNSAMEKFEKYELKFNKYFWEQDSKVEICKQENIDVMIDDKSTICKSVSENKIKALYFRDVSSEKLQENEYLKEVNNWGEIYRYIYNMNK